VSDSRNHPSIAIWDACNETWPDVLRTDVIPAAREWISQTARGITATTCRHPNDPVEDHPYLFSEGGAGARRRPSASRLETMAHYKQSASPHPTAHASILHEYGWLWLTRDGSPTVLTREVYDTCWTQATGEQRFRSGPTGRRADRSSGAPARYHAGVHALRYLMSSFPGVYPTDHFRYVESWNRAALADYVGEAFQTPGPSTSLLAAKPQSR